MISQVMLRFPFCTALAVLSIVICAFIPLLFRQDLIYCNQNCNPAVPSAARQEVSAMLHIILGPAKSGKTAYLLSAASAPDCAGTVQT